MNIDNIQLPDYINESLGNTSRNEEEQIKNIFQMESWHSHANDRLKFREYTEPINSDEGLDTLIELYLNKKSKRVKYAGDKLRKVFLDLPPIEQRKVGRALILGNKTDSEWVCQRLEYYKPRWYSELIVNWHPSYEAVVAEAWEKYKGLYCGKLIIHFFNSKAVSKYMPELINDDQFYIEICKRFVKEPWFSLDIERLARLTTIDVFLSIVSQTKQGISSAEAEKLLFQWTITIASFIKDSFEFKPNNVFWSHRQQHHRVINAWGLDTALYYMLQMKQTDVVRRFLKWDQLVNQMYYSKINIDDDSSENLLSFVDTIIDAIPQEYKEMAILDGGYIYVRSLGQVYVQPKPKTYYKISNSNEKTSNSNEITEKKEPRHQYKNGTITDFKSLLIRNSYLNSLVDELDLEFVNDLSSKEEEPPF